MSAGSNTAVPLFVPLLVRPSTNLPVESGRIRTAPAGYRVRIGSNQWSLRGHSQVPLALATVLRSPRQRSTSYRPLGHAASR